MPKINQAIGLQKIISPMVSVVSRKDSLGHIARLVLSSGFIILLNLVTGMIVARTLGPSGRGEQAAILMWSQFFTHLLTMGLPSAMIYTLQKKLETPERLYGASILLCIGLGALGVIPALFFVPLWMGDYSKPVIWFAQILMVTIPLGLLTFVNNAILQANNEFGLVNFMRYAMPAGTLLFLLLFLATDTLNPYTSAFSYAFPTIPIQIWLLMRLAKKIKPVFSKIREPAKKLTSYGFRSYGIDIAGTLSLHLDQIIVVGMLSPANLGLYVIALSLSRMLSMIQSSINLVLFPKASALNGKDAVQLTIRIWKCSLITTGLLAAFLAVAAPIVLHLLYGPAYMPAVPVFRILLLQVMVTSSAWGLSQAFMATGRPGTLTLIQASMVVLNVPLLLLLIPPFGIAGAGLALLLTSIIRFIAILVLYNRLLHVPFSHFIYTRADIRWFTNQLKNRANREAKSKEGETG
ncbi:oligosaccharide flippase family protein [Paenibacillus sp. IB182496]|uniref:Oligosaccharide flippase family protein n=1 Tax=Paenibacillus sabuli TaxID=2772509 RepID=A0A927BNT1_9BACL|nr:oligosaccharide flippase family protein [Paenibacillus sabuli]MBD2843957.1 oligosaccharide flippase family protein [Paenibacillus sabuli]